MSGEAALKLAILIDADNASPTTIRLVLAEIAKYGIAVVKRAYGDFTEVNLKGWKDPLLEHSIIPMQQFAGTHGKNSTVAAMVIDAMDLLYSYRFDGFCLVSSDSDFTRLASRLRESGLVVFGCGEYKTPRPFVTACDMFIYLENLVQTEQARPFNTVIHGPVMQAGSDIYEQVMKSLLEAVDAMSDFDGWACLSNVGNLIMKRHPDFDPRSHGYTKLSELVGAFPVFEVIRRCPGQGKPPIIYLRKKKGSYFHSS